MAKFASENMLDGSLEVIRTQVTRMAVCEGQPMSYASASLPKGGGGQMLAEVAVSAGEMAIAAGDLSGRKVTLPQKSGVTVLETGVANHVALLAVAGSTLEYVTTAASQNLTAGNLLTFQSWDIEIADPV